MAAKSSPKISLIGSGKVGSTLTLALYQKGYRVVSIINRTGKPALALATKVKCKKVSTHIGDVDTSSEIILIAVPDGELEGIARELSTVKHLKFKKLFVAHTSGAYSSDVLTGLQKKGSLIASMHPVQTFPQGAKPVKLRGIYFGIEGSPASLAKAEHIVHDIEARAVNVPKELKPLYHVACVFASSYMISIFNCIAELTKLSQLKASWMEVFGPLMTSAMENTIKTSAANALTGPVVRNDTSTISLHLNMLAQHAPQFLPIYCVAGIDVARTAAEHGKLSKQEYQNIVTLFRTFIKSYPEIKKNK
jgi:predicted short-subunit dehydrogenase-like oxidoreductase (DUF2520 family)